MTPSGLASRQRTFRFPAVTTTHEDGQFDAADEAFFNAAYDDARADGALMSERPVTIDLEEEEQETAARPLDAAALQRLQARQARLTQRVSEIVATLALLSATALGMHYARGPASTPQAAASPASQLAPEVYRPTAGARSAPGS